MEELNRKTLPVPYSQLLFLFVDVIHPQNHKSSKKIQNSRKLYERACLGSVHKLFKL